MGRNKKIKTNEEKIEYQLKRREQNRINQRRFRNRKKLKDNLNYISSNFIDQSSYKIQLSRFLKEIGFNYFITLTSKENFTGNKIRHYTEKLIKSLYSEFQIDNVFYVVESSSFGRFHTHILLKSVLEYNKIKLKIYQKWNKGYVFIKNIYSKTEDISLENYVIKDISLNSQNEEYWNIM